MHDTTHDHNGTLASKCGVSFWAAIDELNIAMQ
jgi:hypothetical protein